MAEDDFEMSGSESQESGGKKKTFGGFNLKLEGIIPIIVIIIVILLIIFKTNIFSGGIPFMDNKGSSILVVGAPSPEFTQILNDFENRDLIKEKRIIDVGGIEHNPKERLKQYDIVILDQSFSSDKSITRTVGEAMKNYVQSGGSLMVVLNSGIKRPDDLSIIGWKATFKDVIPVTCDPTYGTYSCLEPIMTQGIIYATNSNSKSGAYKIMYGIDKVPPVETAGLLQTETFDVGVSGNEIAYLQDARSGHTYPAIVEKPLLLGKVLYFNYNPGLSEAIFVNSLKYLS